MSPRTAKEHIKSSPSMNNGESAHAPIRQNYFMYVLSCADGTLYTGYTTNVQQRLRAHNAAKGAKYTRGRLPVKLVVQVRFATKHEAMSAEYRFKRLTRLQKEAFLDQAALSDPARDAARSALEAFLGIAPLDWDADCRKRAGGVAASASDDTSGKQR